MNWSSPGINAKVEHFVGRTWVVRVLPSHGRVDSPFCALTSAELCNKESGSIHIAENAQEKGGKGRPGTMLSDCHLLFKMLIIKHRQNMGKCL